MHAFSSEINEFREPRLHFTHCHCLEFTIPSMSSGTQSLIIISTVSRLLMTWPFAVETLFMLLSTVGMGWHNVLERNLNIRSSNSYGGVYDRAWLHYHWQVAGLEFVTKFLFRLLPYIYKIWGRWKIFFSVSFPTFTKLFVAFPLLNADDTFSSPILTTVAQVCRFIFIHVHQFSFKLKVRFQVLR